MVSKFLGFSKPSYAGRTAVRGFVFFNDGHGFDPKLMQFFGKGVRFGVIPCDDHGVYWFLTFSPSSLGKVLFLFVLLYRWNCIVVLFMFKKWCRERNGGGSDQVEATHT